MGAQSCTEKHKCAQVHKILPLRELLAKRAELTLSNCHLFLSFSTYNIDHIYLLEGRPTTSCSLESSYLPGGWIDSGLMTFLHTKTSWGHRYVSYSCFTPKLLSFELPSDHQPRAEIPYLCSCFEFCQQMSPGICSSGSEWYLLSDWPKQLTVWFTLPFTIAISPIYQKKFIAISTYRAWNGNEVPIAMTAEES